VLRVAEHFSDSDTGRARRSNEDSFFARAPLFVVADGMGGAQAGEVASQMAVEPFEGGLDGEGSPEQRLATLVREANGRIHALSREDDQRAGMGTTITAIYVDECDVCVAHVGDSRAYRLRAGRLERLTDDHSLVGELQRQGKLTAQEAEEHPQRSIITRALGPEPDVEVDTYSWRAEPDDLYLLCSDGLTSMISEERVGEIVREPGALRAVGAALIAAANEAGGRDNITVVLFRLEGVEGAGDAAAEQQTMAGAGAPRVEDVRAAAAAQEPARRLSPRAPGSAAAPSEAEGPTRRRKLAIGSFVALLLVLPLVLGGFIATQAVYFIGANDEGFVTMYRGLPYELPAGVDLYKVNYVTGVPASEVPAPRRETLLDQTLRSRDDAADLLRQLERGGLTG
jgi:protein phosphatase